MSAGWEALGAVGGSLLGGTFDLIGASMANAQNKRAAKEARAYATWQLQNRYQETRKDMEKAGLNPLLAFGSSAGGNVPSVGAVQAPARNVLEGLGNSARNVGVRMQEFKARSQALKNMEADEGKIKADTRLQEELKNRAEVEQVGILAQASSALENADLTRLRYNLLKKEEPFANLLHDLSKEGVDLFRWGRSLLEEWFKSDRSETGARSDKKVPPGRTKPRGPLPSGR